jgi:hypothetical protein
MSNRTNPNTLLLISVFLLAMVGTTFAGPLLFPARVGLRWEFNRSDSDDPVNQWPMHYEITSQITYNSVDYFQLQVWNYDNDSAYEDAGYIRSTETAVYGYNPTGDDYLEFQAAPVGTKWSFYQEHDSGWNYKFIEIVAIELVTVPYGTFNEAYNHRRYLCANSDGSGDRSPYWYEWVVPGVGKVKEVDYWTEQIPPLTMELISVIIAADFDIGRDTLSLKSKAKWITCYIRFPAGYNLADVVPGSILLDVDGNGVVTPNRTRFHKAKKMLIVKFEQSEVQNFLNAGEAELTISGELTDGTEFEGTDAVSVVM